MSLTIGIVALMLAIFLTIWFGWRYSARVTSTPCPSWLAWMLDLNWDKTTVLDELTLAPGLNVVDVGCGPGRLTLPIAERIAPGGEVVALDMQEKMLARLNKRLAQTRLTNVRTLHGGAGTGLLPEARFDRALLVTVLGEIPDRSMALREIHAALKPGAYLLISEVIGDPHYQTQTKVRSLAHECGFEFRDLKSRLFSYTARLYKPA